MKKWQSELKQAAMDFYRGAGQTLTLSEIFRGVCRAYRKEASAAEMRKFFNEQMKTWHEFYSDTETVRALMACNH